MGTTRGTLSYWFEDGQKQGRKRMIVWCDTYDYSDYPEYSDLTGEDLQR